jgi:nucleotide-binding universal stress UspA family protein
VKKEASLAGVECETITATRAHPYEAIISVAIQQKCDLIVMASHGRRGNRSLLLGSETQKVLTHSDIPVLVLQSYVTLEAVSGKEHGTPRDSGQ